MSDLNIAADSELPPPVAGETTDSDLRNPPISGGASTKSDLTGEWTIPVGYWHELYFSDETKRRLDFLHETGTLEGARQYMLRNHRDNLVEGDVNAGLSSKVSFDPVGPFGPREERTWSRESDTPSKDEPAFPFSFSFKSDRPRTCVFDKARSGNLERITMVDQEAPNVTSWSQLITSTGTAPGPVTKRSTSSYVISTDGEMISMTTSGENRRAVVIRGEICSQLILDSMPTLLDPLD